MTQRKEFEPGFSKRDTAFLLGYPEASHTRIAKLYELFPEADGRSSLVDLLRRAIADQLLRVGCTDKQTVDATRTALKWINDDIDAGKQPGVIVCLCSLRDVWEVKFFSDDELDEIDEIFEGDNGNNLDACVSIYQVHVVSLIHGLMANLSVRIRGLSERKQVNVESMKKALEQAGKLRALVESAYQREEK